MKATRLVPGLLVVVLVLVLVGMAFPPTVPSDLGSSESYTNGTVAVEGGEIDADATALWAWTQRAMDSNVDATPTVRIRDFDDGAAGRAMATERTEFQRLLVYDDPDDEPPGGILAFVTLGSTDVHVNGNRLPAVKNGTTGRSVEALLVHEFAHVVQFQSQAVLDSQPPLLSATTDDTRAYQATIEGGAEFVADGYTEDSEIERVRGYWNDPRTSAAARMGQWPYYRGLVYFDAVLEGPDDVWSIYEDRPRSTAAILRNETPGEGPPDRSLSLEIDDYHTEVQDRPGAMFAEIALSREIAPQRARDVAAGWRWGALRSIQPDRGTDADRSNRHVWVTEWQGEAEADAFETAMVEYLDGRWSSDGGTWTASGNRSFALERVDDDAVAVLVGPDAFLAEAAVRAEGDEYRITSAGGSTTAEARTAGAAATSAAWPSGSSPAAAA